MTETQIAFRDGTNASETEPDGLTVPSHYHRSGNVWEQLSFNDQRYKLSIAQLLNRQWENWEELCNCLLA